MSTTGQFSTKSPTIKRILKESQELTLHPSPDFSAGPLESNLFEWHFTLRGPPSPSPFASGLYHGRIVLPPSYPLRPPSFRFLTPSGRFEVNREICLSISGFHEETWQPAWGIRTALLAIRGFMDSEAGGAVGGMDADEGVKRRLAGESKGWKCGTCGKENGEIMRENEELCGEGEGVGQEKVPDELRLGYREELGNGQGKEVAGRAGDETGKGATDVSKIVENNQEDAGRTTTDTLGGVRAPRALPAQMPVRSVEQRVHQQTPTRVPARPPTTDTAWLDKAIVGVAGALIFMIIKHLFL
ncbi:Ubiquitin-conjugating enzyme E2 J1 [Sphaceloma murrayae]|uniref:Ubiquitin-conjugating enzyme E2 J1 n=1 Tax=Sphaceloma murrayae TaxID=2082308 RepID=A0A2K1QW54_9PEZI|nr:Ubiquitin-conjugating enzyme E2 J1 [Sphaceloma murrayae]